MYLVLFQMNIEKQNIPQQLQNLTEKSKKKKKNIVKT